MLSEGALLERIGYVGNATYLMRNFGPNGITGIVMAAVVSPRLLVQVVTDGSKL